MTDTRPSTKEQATKGREFAPMLREIALDVGRDAAKDAVGPLVRLTLRSAFSDTIRAVVREAAHHALASLIESVADALMAGDAKGEEADRKLAALKRTVCATADQVIDDLFDIHMRSEIQPYVERAVLLLLDGKSDHAGREAMHAADLVLRRLTDTIIGNRDALLRQLTPLVMVVVKKRLKAKSKAALAGLLDIALGGDNRVARKRIDLQEKATREGKRLRHKMRAAASKMRQRLNEGRANIQKRLSEAFKTTGTVGGRNGAYSRLPPGPPRRVAH